jgi:hypothetical protein
MQLYACNLHLSDLIHNNFNDEKHHLEQGTVPCFTEGQVAIWASLPDQDCASFCPTHRFGVY